MCLQIIVLIIATTVSGGCSSSFDASAEEAKATKLIATFEKEGWINESEDKVKELLEGHARLLGMTKQLLAPERDYGWSIQYFAGGKIVLSFRKPGKEGWLTVERLRDGTIRKRESGPIYF